MHPLREAPARLDALALLLGHRLDVRGLSDALGTSPVVVQVSPSSWAVLFRWGAVVLFGADDVERASFLAGLEGRIERPYDAPETEEVRVVVDPHGREGFHDDAIVVRAATVERLQAVAEVLGRAVVLAAYEDEVAEVFDRIEPLAARLEERGHAGREARQLLRHIGGALLIQHRMVGRVEVLEKPEVLWEVPDLERLYVRLEDEYEIRERHLALERKLQLVSRTAETLHELLQTQRALRVEWYIVILILVEIALTLYGMATGTH